MQMHNKNYDMIIKARMHADSSQKDECKIGKVKTREYVQLADLD